MDIVEDDLQKDEHVEAMLRSFPRPGTTLHSLIYDPQFKQTFHARLQQSNRFIVLLYRLGVLPLFGMSKTIMLLITRGRKSGELRTFPVGYQRIGDTLCVFSGWGKTSNWYRNILAHPDQVYVQIGWKRSCVRPETVEDPQELHGLLEWLVLHNPKAAKNLFGWDPETDSLETADFSVIVEKVLTVLFHELPERG
jgi:deazaflavin-dependent oxidoreductase (nitroreductase family)